MRVLHAASIRWNSAIAEYALSAAVALRDEGMDSAMLVLSGAPLERRAITAGLETHALPSFGMKALLRVRAFLQAWKPDVILVHGGPESMLLGLAAGAKIPMIRVRGYAVDDVGVLTGLTHDLGLPGVKAMIAPSQAIATALKNISSLPITTITLGVDTINFSAPESWQAPERPELLIFGRFDPVKGHAEFMRIFRMIMDVAVTPTKPRLRIVGEPENISVRHLQEFAKVAGLQWDEDVVVTAGRVQDVRGLLAGATMGVISSLGSEIICRVAEEFLLCGTPIAVSGVGSLEEVLIDPSMGLSYKNQIPQEAAKNVATALSVYHRETTQERHARAEIAARNFSRKRMGQELAIVVREVFQENRSPSPS